MLNKKLVDFYKKDQARNEAKYLWNYITQYLVISDKHPNPDDAMKETKPYKELIENDYEPMILGPLDKYFKKDKALAYPWCRLLFEDATKAFQWIINGLLQNNPVPCYMDVPCDNACTHYNDIDKANEPPWSTHPKHSKYTWDETFQAYWYFIDAAYFQLTGDHAPEWWKYVTVYRTDGNKIMSRHVHFSKRGTPTIAHESRASAQAFNDLVLKLIETHYDDPEAEDSAGNYARTLSLRHEGEIKHIIDRQGFGDQWRLPLCCKPGKPAMVLDKEHHQLYDNLDGYENLSLIELIDRGNPLVTKPQKEQMEKCKIKFFNFETEKKHKQKQRKIKEYKEKKGKKAPLLKKYDTDYETKDHSEEIQTLLTINDIKNCSVARDGEFSYYLKNEGAMLCPWRPESDPHDSQNAKIYINGDQVKFFCFGCQRTEMIGNILPEQKRNIHGEERKMNIEEKKEIRLKKKDKERVMNGDEERQIKKPRLEEKKSPKKNSFDAKDEFVWLHFQRKYSGKANAFPSKKELIDSLAMDLPRVFASIAGSKMVLVKTKAANRTITLPDQTQKKIYDLVLYEEKKKDEIINLSFYYNYTYDGRTETKEYPFHIFLKEEADKIPLYARRVCNPTKIKDPEDFNTFSGPIAEILDIPMEEAEKDPGVTKLLDFISEVLCGYDRHADKEPIDTDDFKKWPEEKQKYFYFMTFVRTLFEEQDYHPTICFYFFSTLQGTGKNTVPAHWQNCVLGNHLCLEVKGFNNILHHFDSHLRGKRLIVINEIPEEGKHDKWKIKRDFNNFKDQLRSNKKLTTAKHGQSEMTDHYAAYIFTGQGMDRLFLESSDRCFNPYHVNDKRLNDTPYWQDFYNPEGDVFTRHCGDMFRTYVAKNRHFYRSQPNVKGIDISISLKTTTREEIVTACRSPTLVYLASIKKIRDAWNQTPEGQKWLQEFRFDKQKERKESFYPNGGIVWITGKGEVKRSKNTIDEKMRFYQQADAIQVAYLVKIFSKNFNIEMTEKDFIKKVRNYCKVKKIYDRNCIVLDTISLKDIQGHLNIPKDECDEINPYENHVLDDYS